MLCTVPHIYAILCPNVYHDKEFSNLSIFISIFHQSYLHTNVRKQTPVWYVFTSCVVFKQICIVIHYIISIFHVIKYSYYCTHKHSLFVHDCSLLIRLRITCLSSYHCPDNIAKSNACKTNATDRRHLVNAAELCCGLVETVFDNHVSLLNTLETK